LQLLRKQTTNEIDMYFPFTISIMMLKILNEMIKRTLKLTFYYIHYCFTWYIKK